MARREWLRRPQFLWCAPLLALLWPRLALANAGVPMLAVVWPSSWVLFIPVCLVEAAVAHRIMHLPVVESVKLAVIANAWSTFVGIPVTWLALFLVELVGGAAVALTGVELGPAGMILAPLGAPWLGPGARQWHVYGAAALLCIPFMLVSIHVERWSASKRVPAERARRWARAANTVTYLPIIVTLVGLAVSHCLQSH